MNLIVLKLNFFKLIFKCIDWFFIMVIFVILGVSMGVEIVSGFEFGMG